MDTVWNYVNLTSATLETCKTKKDHHSSISRTRDKKDHAQGHVTLINQVTLESYSVELYLFDIRDPRNLQNKKDHHSSVTIEPDIRKVMLRVTWPWRTRSRLIVTVWNYIYLTSATPKTCKTKKDLCSSFTRIRDKKGHVRGHVTLMHRVMLKGCSVDLCSFEFYKQNCIQNSSQIIPVAYPGPDIGIVMWKLLRKSAWPWISRSRFMITHQNFDFWKQQPFQHRFEKKIIKICYGVLEIFDFPSGGKKIPPWAVNVIKIGWARWVLIIKKLISK